MAVLKKHQRHRYAVIDHSALRNEDLSWRATGLLCYLLSLPDEWRVNVADLSNRKTDGRTSTASAMSELEDAGYVVRRKVRDDGGKFHTTVHVAESPELLETAINASELVDQPTLGLPTSVEPIDGLPDTKKEEEEVLIEEVPRREELAPRARDEVWDALVVVFGEPTTRSARSLRNRLVVSLKGAGASGEDVVTRSGTWPLHFPDATFTETALEKHWDRLGRPPLKVSKADVEKFEANQRRERRELEARALEAGT